MASSGLELKVDPGVPLVYTGFGGAPRVRVCVCVCVGWVGGGGGWAGTEGGLGRSLLSCRPSVPPPPLAGLCVTTVVSYLSHSQVWALQQGRAVLVGGRTNRAKAAFRQELAAAAAGLAGVAGPERGEGEQQQR